MTAPRGQKKLEAIPEAPTKETQTEPQTIKNVYMRMLEANAYIDTLPMKKDQKNAQFSSIKIDDMRVAVRAACMKAGLVIVGPSNIDYKMERNGPTEEVTGSCTFKYVNIDDPADFIEYSSIGQARDNGDKVLSKFITMLIKNHYKVAFNIGPQDGKDDTDSYSAEEQAAETARINKLMTADPPKKRTPAEDPFFRPKQEMTPEERENAAAAKKVALIKRVETINAEHPETNDTIGAFLVELGVARVQDLNIERLEMLISKMKGAGQ